MTIWSCIADRLGIEPGDLDQARLEPISGGDINQCYRWQIGDSSYFVKLQPNAPDGFFQAEAAGLRQLAETGCIRVPRVLAIGIEDHVSYLVLEWISMRPASRVSQRLLGEQLARMHQRSQTCFGGGQDNWIGTTPQLNPNASDWVEFYRAQRLAYQLMLAEQHGFPSLIRSAELVMRRLPDFFVGYQPVPSLLHGDLWSGNQAMDESGQPVIFDPACSWGDRETDLAMTELFGGFDRGFYEAYASVWPLDPGYDRRRDLYQLYHVLNHVNLFGGGYVHQAEGLLGRLKRSLADL